MSASKFDKAAALPRLCHRPIGEVKSGLTPQYLRFTRSSHSELRGSRVAMGSWLQIAIQANCAQMEPEFVAVTFLGARSSSSCG